MKSMLVISLMVILIFSVTLVNVVYAIDYRDSTGYTPSWAKGQGYHYVLNECNYLTENTRDGNWCMEWVAYVLDQGFENFPQSTSESNENISQQTVPSNDKFNELRSFFVGFNDPQITFESEKTIDGIPGNTKAQLLRTYMNGEIIQRVLVIETEQSTSEQQFFRNLIDSLRSDLNDNSNKGLVSWNSNDENCSGFDANESTCVIKSDLLGYYDTVSSTYSNGEFVDPKASCFVTMTIKTSSEYTKSIWCIKGKYYVIQSTVSNKYIGVQEISLISHVIESIDSKYEYQSGGLENLLEDPEDNKVYLLNDDYKLKKDSIQLTANKITSVSSGNYEVTISPAPGSGSPGCEETAEGCFIPKVTSVAVGGKVIFSNTDTAAHTFTAGTEIDGPSGVFDTSLVMSGNSYEWTATTTGEFPYYCMVHPWMVGEITVTKSSLHSSPIKTVSISESISPNSIYEKISNFLSKIQYTLGDRTTITGDGVLKTSYKIFDTDGNALGVVNIWTTNTILKQLEISTFHTSDSNSISTAIIVLAGLMKEVMGQDGSVQEFTKMIKEASDGTDSTRITPDGHILKVSSIIITEDDPGLGVLIFNVDYNQNVFVSSNKDKSTPQSKITSKETSITKDKSTKELETNSKGGGCLIATATYGSELAPQVQQLRELRDNNLLQTESGTSFMNSFNQFYYTFSPTIADFERENPLFKEGVKLFITPMLSTLSIMTLADDSESQVLGLGISVILLNLGIYVIAPAFGIAKLKSRLQIKQIV